MYPIILRNNAGANVYALGINVGIRGTRRVVLDCAYEQLSKRGRLIELLSWIQEEVNLPVSCRYPVTLYEPL